MGKAGMRARVRRLKATWIYVDTRIIRVSERVNKKIEEKDSVLFFSVRVRQKERERYHQSPIGKDVIG